MPDARTSIEHAAASKPGTIPVAGLAGQLKLARETAARSIHDCARLIGIGSGRYAAYEAGSRQPSMPELEQLALFLQVPLDAFFDESEIAPLVPTPIEVGEVMALRARIIGARLRKARLDSGQQLAMTALALGMRARDLERFELAEKALPVGRLELAAHHFGLQRKDLLDVEQAGSAEATAGAPPTGSRQQYAQFVKLPADVREALMLPDALVFIRAGLRLRGLRTKDLRRAGKALDKLAGIVKPQ